MTMKDTEVYEILQAEENRQKSILRMIPSECIMSDDVLACSGSRIAQKYSEGFIGKRYYQGQINTDKIESLCIERAKQTFNLPNDWHVNCQALSGSPANLAVYTALCKPGDKVIGLGLNSGGWC